MVAPKSTDDSIKAKLAKWKKNESEEVDEGILSKLAGKIMGAAPKEPKYKVGQVVSYETPEDQPDWKDRGRGKGTITKYSNGHYIVNGNPVNHFDIKKVHESVDPDESSKGHTMEAHGVKGSIEEVSTARLKSYAEKAREDAEKLTKQGDRAKKVAIKPGFYMFSGSVKTADGKDSKVIHYLKNKPLKDKHSLWGMHTPTELAYDPQGFWKIVFNAKQGYHARLTEEQAAGVVAKSRFLGNDAAARSMMELY